jgi:anti-sigma regulatory factor (Ser/Thr protein kinase)
MNGPAYVELSFRPNADLVSLVRRFVSDFYTEIVRDPESVSSLALATHELLENAVRYATSPESRVRIEVGNGRPRPVSVTTWNRAEPANIERLQALVDEMRREPDAAAFYQKVMRRSAKVRGESGLGLARIHAEADMRLSLEVQAGEVCLRAATAVDDRRVS